MLIAESEIIAGSPDLFRMAAVLLGPRCSAGGKEVQEGPARASAAGALASPAACPRREYNAARQKAVSIFP